VVELFVSEELADLRTDETPSLIFAAMIPGNSSARYLNAGPVYL
jgi:hypothetical protein